MLLDSERLCANGAAKSRRTLHRRLSDGGRVESLGDSARTREDDGSRAGPWASGGGAYAVTLTVDAVLGSGSENRESDDVFLHSRIRAFARTRIRGAAT